MKKIQTWVAVVAVVALALLLGVPTWMMMRESMQSSEQAGESARSLNSTLADMAP